MDIKKRRQQDNQRILDRMRNGDCLQDDATNTFYPPRKIIRKDKKLMARLYEKKD